MQAAAETFDHVIIGSGFGGSVSAMRLTEKGYRVLVLERGGDFGGRAHSQVWQGFHLNAGAHALYKGGAGWAVLKALGVRLEGAEPRLKGRGLRHADGRGGAVGVLDVDAVVLVPPSPVVSDTMAVRRDHRPHDPERLARRDRGEIALAARVRRLRPDHLDILIYNVMPDILPIHRDITPDR